ncbi:MAG: hypothetical protein HQM12_15010 [SAR324 cluster bacterium]|nr:hypothetical protein [SAR324 cluster bacterium]
MAMIQDSMLALIIRFVAGNKKINFCDNEFIQQQLDEIQAFIERFPEAEQEYQAMVWIQTYARKYRETWEKEIITQEMAHQRCADCPLRSGASYCEIRLST